MLEETKSLWRADFDRWEFDPGGRSFEISHLKDFAANRPDYVRQHMIDEFDLEGLARMTLGTERGDLLVNGLSIGEKNTGEWFTGSVLTLSLSDSTGFSKWSDGHE
ncbi:MAG: hypothetical protein GY786_20375, partial [Proteobacteria bacterium]|nr:hypothetical protein [Pseudomonadota bacterium]